MDNLHHVLRNIHETKTSRRDHLAVFREFLGHLDRIDKRAPRVKATRGKAKSTGRRGR